MFGANSPNAIRMLQQLYTLNTPPPAPAPRQAPAKRETIRHVKARAPSVSSSESESDDDMSMSEASTSSYESYDEPEVIYTKIVKEKKCPYVSPAGLASKKTKKEAVKYLKEKGCPDTESLRKAKTEPTPTVETDEMMKAAPTTSITQTQPVKKTVKKAAAAPVVETKVAEVKAPEVKVSSTAAAIAEKPKRELTAYQKFVQDQRKAGKSMAEAAAAWKAQKA